MKKTLSLFTFFVVSLFLLSNFTSDRTSAFIMTMVNEAPVLPATPYNYSEIDLPRHLLEEMDDVNTGYDGRIDTSSFTSITDDLATLGRVLFYDEKLSALENISCASCHDQSLSFTENKPFSEGINSQTKRNSMHLNDLGWTNNKGFAWDMRVTDFHEMIKLPLTDENEIGANMLEVSTKLGDTEYYPELFENAFGDGQINEERIIDALVQFIKSMTTFNSKFDQGSDNGFQDFSVMELRGKDLFSMNCSTCHSQGNGGIFGLVLGEDGMSPLEVFPPLFNNGLPEDQDDAGAGEWNDDFSGLFKVPTLKNIEMTAPYMHDGRFNTLEEVVDHYSEGMIENQWSFFPPGGFLFSDSDKSALVAFLKTLTDQSFITDDKWASPFGITSTSKTEIQNIILKPNPMAARAVIEFDNPSSKLVSINVLSSDGRLLRHDSTDADHYAMEKKDFSSGVYYIELIIEDARSVQKLIVH